MTIKSLLIFSWLLMSLAVYAQAQIFLTKISDQEKVVEIKKDDHAIIKYLILTKKDKQKRISLEGNLMEFSKDSITIYKLFSRKTQIINSSDVIAFTKINPGLRTVEYLATSLTLFYSYFNVSSVILGLPKGTWGSILGLGLMERIFHPARSVGGEHPKWLMEIKTEE